MSDDFNDDNYDDFNEQYLEVTWIDRIVDEIKSEISDRYDPHDSNPKIEIILKKIPNISSRDELSAQINSHLMDFFNLTSSRIQTVYTITINEENNRYWNIITRVLPPEDPIEA